MKDKATPTTDGLKKLTEIIGDEDKAKEVIDAAKVHGPGHLPVDLVNIEAFAKRVISLAEYRKSLHSTSPSKMNAVRVSPTRDAAFRRLYAARRVTRRVARARVFSFFPRVVLVVLAYPPGVSRL